jgi:hypothetical protein
LVRHSPTGAKMGDKPYQNYLNEFPEALRPQVEPIFDKWDTDMNNRFKDIHEQYEPYKTFVDNNVDPDYLQAGVGLLEQVNNDPQKVFTALANHLQTQGVDLSQLVQGFGGTPSQQQTTDTSEYGDVPAALIEKLEKANKLAETNAAAFVQYVERENAQREQSTKEQEEQRAMQELSDHLDKVAPADKYHRPFILAYLAQGSSVDQAVNEYNSWYQGQVGGSGNVSAPRVAPGGGGLPSSQIDTAKMGSQDTKNMVVEFLKRANLEG